ncbi:Pleiotropic drug resistance protein [Melia azedarach]|uniref:Pleiotropic drug resistance protein n=1 Tax=Melia azedarach TaxID=155640 RepID=A0ACC1X4P2_MELAZ|nr:Pleiotropic drug resistance protein [Melia azedarach]
MSQMAASATVKSLDIEFADDNGEEYAQQWAEIERLPTFERLRSSFLDDKGKKMMIDVTKLEAVERLAFIEKLIKRVEDDNLRLLQKIRDRIDKVGIKQTTVEVRYKNLRVEAECEVVHGKPLPTLWNSLKGSISDFANLFGCMSNKAKLTIIDDVTGVIKPGRMMLLLGPPGCGKTSLLKALSGNLNQSLKVTGEVSYNGYKLDEFIPQKMSAYVSQYDMHIPEMTVRETLDFSARCQGVGSRADSMLEVTKREKEAGIVPDPDIDTYMKILGLDTCAVTMVGNAMRRGVSGGQKKRRERLCIMKSVLEFFEGCGFKCPERKAVADFLQEVISRKDQEQCWFHTELPYRYVSLDMFSNKFKESSFGKKLYEDLSEPYDKSKSQMNALSSSMYSVSRWELFKACLSREFLLMKRNSFIYIFKSSQLIVIAIIAATVFLRTQMNIDILHATYYMGALYYALYIILVDGVPEVSLTVARLPIFYKQKELCFYPSWAYVIPAAVLKLPLSLLESLIWTSFTYYVIGYSPEFWSLPPSLVEVGILGVPCNICKVGLSINEFLAPRWKKALFANTTIGNLTLESRGVNFAGYFFWISIGALIGFSLLFNIGFTLALRFLKPARTSRAIISYEKLPRTQNIEDLSDGTYEKENPKIDTSTTHSESTKDIINLTFWAQCQSTGRMVLPFEPATITFQDVQYYVDTPLEMRKHGFAESRMQLLSDITGAFRPGVLTALMGVTGAGKTTLLDVLARRKKNGYIEGEIKINGYPKVQETFARISGYCEQTDIHSPQITVEESLVFSTRLRLSPQTYSKTKMEFINEVLETIELEGIKDSLVGIPGVSGLSIEQRKRLTIAVELVGNPSIIFMDEPTTGLDARAAAIVMRAVKNVADTGRTIVCTIHQPSIDIFESFDEVASASTEAQLGLDLAQIYKDSTLYEINKELVKTLSKPLLGSSDLHFPTQFAQNGWEQFKSCLWKQHLSYWRSPSYNLTRITYAFLGSLVFGIIYWNQGKEINNQQNLFNILGLLSVAVFFFGINNCTSVLPYVETERTVMYRERFAGMYSPWAYAQGQVIIEIPYVFIQTIIYILVTYPMIGYYGSADKIIWSFYMMFCTLLYYNYLGMFLMSLTPNFVVASILAAASYAMLNLFSGFFIPKPQIPKWWIWFYYIMPSSWTLKGLLTSIYGDIDKEIMIFGETKTVTASLRDYFGFDHDDLAISAIVLGIFPLTFAFLFSYFVERLNFQSR